MQVVFYSFLLVSYIVSWIYGNLSIWHIGRREIISGKSNYNFIVSLQKQTAN